MHPTKARLFIYSPAKPVKSAKSTGTQLDPAFPEPRRVRSAKLLPKGIVNFVILGTANGSLFVLTVGRSLVCWQVISQHPRVHITRFALKQTPGMH